MTDPLDRYLRVLVDREKVEQREIDAVDARVSAEVDEAASKAEDSPAPDGRDALLGVLAEPSAVAPHWYRAAGEPESDAGHV